MRMSWRAESNCRPIAYEAIALPTELRQHLSKAIISNLSFFLYSESDHQQFLNIWKFEEFEHIFFDQIPGPTTDDQFLQPALLLHEVAYQIEKKLLENYYPVSPVSLPILTVNFHIY
jgi:hypothetical protein